MSDFFLFVELVKKQRSNAEHKTLTLRSLQLADQLYVMARNNVDSQL